MVTTLPCYHYHSTWRRVGIQTRLRLNPDNWTIMGLKGFFFGRWLKKSLSILICLLVLLKIICGSLIFPVGRIIDLNKSTFALFHSFIKMLLYKNYKSLCKVTFSSGVCVSGCSFWYSCFCSSNLCVNSPYWSSYFFRSSSEINFFFSYNSKTRFALILPCHGGWKCCIIVIL